MPIYMKIEGIKGESKAPRDGWIELQSCQIGSGRGTGGSRGDGNTYSATNEVVITKNHDSASASIFNEAIQGSGKKVVIEFTNDDNSVYLAVELENALVSSYSISGSGDKPVESLSLNATKISYSSKPPAKQTTGPRSIRMLWDMFVSKKTN